MASVTVQPGTPDDLPALRAMNDLEVPRVNILAPELFAETAQEAALFVVASIDGVPAGFAWVLGPRRSYPSENYAWFGARHDNFWYLDRIVVHGGFRRRGVARALYAAVFEAAGAAKVPCITCEVNTEPANPASLALHESLGFEGVGHRTAGGKTVVMLQRNPDVQGGYAGQAA